MSISSHTRAILQALLVTFLWSTSWILIKIGLDDIPALTFAGLRYSLAFLCLLPLGLRGERGAALRGLSRKQWGQLALLGLIFYSVTQGTQFVGLDYLPAVTLSLLMNFTSIVVAFLGMWLLREYLTRRQWLGIGVFLSGVLIYFYPLVLPTDQVFGMLIGIMGMLANATASIIGRSVNRQQSLSPITVTTVSMGIGASVLLATGLLTQGLPPLDLKSWLIILWLAVVNTAFAFTLWNHTLRTLSAAESSVINNTMLIQIGVLAWVFLGEAITPQEGVGMILAAVGILVVQLRPTRRASAEQDRAAHFHRLAENPDADEDHRQ